MRLQSSALRRLVACCMLFLVAVSFASRMKDTCDHVLTVPADSPPGVSEGNGNIDTRSLSPWKWIPNTVENRIPATIWEAHCEKDECFLPNSKQRGSARGHNAVPIYQQLLVLQGTGMGRCYNATFLSVAVGCTCVRARTNPSL